MTFDPTTLAWSYYYRASYGASLPDWSPTATAGSSGSNGYLKGFGGSPAGPTVGTAVNALTPAHYDGTARYSTSDTGVLDTTLFTSTTALTMVAYVKVNEAGAAASGNVYDDKTLFRNTNSNQGISWTSSGWSVYAYDGGYKTKNVACAAGSYNAIRCRLLSGVLSIKLNAGTTQTVVCGALTYGGDALQIAISYLNTYLDCDVLEFGAMVGAMSDANWTDYLSYITDTYPALSAINGTSAAVFGQTGSAKGAGTLAGTVPVVFGQTGTAAGVARLVGVGTGVFGQTGSAKGSATLVGTSPAVFGQTGSAKGDGTLGGAVAAVFGQAGVAGGSASCVGITGGVFSQTGTLLGVAGCIGTSPVSFAASGSLLGTGTLGGTCPVVFTPVAHISSSSTGPLVYSVKLRSTVAKAARLATEVHKKTRVRSTVDTVSTLSSEVRKKTRLRSKVYGPGGE